jgi:Protein of unknown function (DUF3618)
MDEAARQSSEAVGSAQAAAPTEEIRGESEKPRSPDEIRREIEQTREELGETVEELVEKGDVKARLKERLDAAKHAAMTKRDEVRVKARSAAAPGADAAANQLKAKARENPLPFAVGGALLAGFVLGRRSTR